MHTYLERESGGIGHGLPLLIHKGEAADEEERA